MVKSYKKNRKNTKKSRKDRKRRTMRQRGGFWPFSSSTPTTPLTKEQCDKKWFPPSECAKFKIIAVPVVTPQVNVVTPDSLPPAHVNIVTPDSQPAPAPAPVSGGKRRKRR